MCLDEGGKACRLSFLCHVPPVPSRQRGARHISINVLVESATPHTHTHIHTITHGFTHALTRTNTRQKRFLLVLLSSRLPTSLPGALNAPFVNLLFSPLTQHDVACSLCVFCGFVQSRKRLTPLLPYLLVLSGRCGSPYMPPCTFFFVSLLWCSGLWTTSSSFFLVSDLCVRVAPPASSHLCLSVVAVRHGRFLKSTTCLSAAEHVGFWGFLLPSAPGDSQIRGGVVATSLFI